MDTGGAVVEHIHNMETTHGESVVMRMRAKFSEHHGGSVPRKPLLRRIIAPVEKWSWSRSHPLEKDHAIPHPMIQKRVARFDDSVVKREEARSSALKSTHHGSSVEHGHKQSALCLQLTRSALERELKTDDRCIKVWDAIVSSKSRERSWPSVVAVVVNEYSPVKAALFVLGVIEHEEDPLRIRVVLPVNEKSSVYMLGSGSLGFRTLVSGERETFHFHMPSVQSLWLAFNTINSVMGSTVQRKQGGLADDWFGTYCSRQEEEKESDVESYSPSSSSSSDSMLALEDTQDLEVHKDIIFALKEILLASNLDELTCGIVYEHLERRFGEDLRPKYKRFIDEKMMMVMGQMEVSSEIFDNFLYLGSEWNACNIDELERHKIDCVLNVTKEIPSVYQDQLIYHRIPIWDVPAEDLLTWLPDAVDFLIQTQRRGSRCLVHCQRGISRSASVVIAYGMKAYGWTLEESFQYVKRRRNIIKPNAGFWKQLETYEARLKDRGSINLNRNHPLKMNSGRNNCL